MIRKWQIAVFVIGACFVASTVDGWFQSICIVVGCILMFTRIDFSPTVAQRALFELVTIHTKLFVLQADLEREWLPMGGQENEAKRVIVAEIHDLTPEFVRQLIEENKK